jgi:hypothetical protein
MHKLILTDVDDTVLRYTDYFQEWAEKQGFSFSVPLRSHYSIEQATGATPEETFALMRRFVDEGWLNEQPPEECALEVLPELHKAGYTFVAITACGGDEAFRNARKRRLEEVFGFRWQAVHVLPLRAAKTEQLRAYSPSVWVEDNALHAIDGASVGHRTFLLTRPYNECDPIAAVTRVRSWHDIAEQLL